MSKKTKKTVLSLSNSREKSKIIPSVSALNASQKNVLKTIADEQNHIIFVSGVAGSGKTFCSVAWGLEQFTKGFFKKLIITRPAVEAGEKLGFLPGSSSDKLSVYMLPILDVFNEYLSQEDIRDLIAENKIIMLPLAFMRGNTFKDAFVILDEGQNTTISQMNLFLTRIGKNSKMIITGDPSQSDIGKHNGFNDALIRLKNIPGLAFAHLDADSVVRHPIIKDISERYSEK